MKKCVLAVVIFFGAAAGAWAHGDMDHILGVVSKINGDLVVVTKDGKDTSVYLRDFTKYELGPKATSRSELHTGDRVVIHAKKKDNKEEAYDVHFMHPAVK